jgi:hypothetical protein
MTPKKSKVKMKIIYNHILFYKQTLRAHVFLPRNDSNGCKFIWEMYASTHYSFHHYLFSKNMKYNINISINHNSTCCFISVRGKTICMFENTANRGGQNGLLALCTAIIPCGVY